MFFGNIKLEQRQVQIYDFENTHTTFVFSGRVRSVRNDYLFACE